MLFRSRFELFIEMMSSQLNLLKNETARYELIETQNEKLNQDLEVTRLERESIRKTLTVSAINQKLSNSISDIYVFIAFLSR